MPREITSCNHEGGSLSEKEFEADVKFHQTNFTIIFNERHRQIYENCKTTISWGREKKEKAFITLISLQNELANGDKRYLTNFWKYYRYHMVMSNRLRKRP